MMYLYPPDNPERPFSIEFKPVGDFILCWIECLDLPEIPIAHQDRGELLKQVLETVNSPVSASLRPDGMITLSCLLSTRDLEGSRFIFKNYFDLFRRLYRNVIQKRRQAPPKVQFIFPGRFQPYHNGHHDIVRRLARKDGTVFPEAADRNLLRYTLDRIVIAIADHGDLDRKENPLTVGERRTLISVAIESDRELKKNLTVHGATIEIDRVQQNFDYSSKLLELAKGLHLAGTPVFITDNFTTLAALRSAGIICAKVRNRVAKNPTISGTKIRKSIRRKQFQKIGKCFPNGVFAEMRKRNLLNHMREILGG